MVMRRPTLRLLGLSNLPNRPNVALNSRFEPGNSIWDYHGAKNQGRRLIPSLVVGFSFGAFPLKFEPDGEPGEEWSLVGVVCKRRLKEVRVRLDGRAHSAEEPCVRKLIDSFHAARINDVE